MLLMKKKKKEKQSWHRMDSLQRGLTSTCRKQILKIAATRMW